MQAMVVYSSETGNTQKIAAAIFAAIPGESKDMQRVDEYRGKDADTFFVGFRVEKGDCDVQTANLLSSLHGKRIALFCACRNGRDSVYNDRIIRQVKSWIAPGNIYMGTFLCQGKMPMQVRKQYEAQLALKNEEELYRQRIRDFDQALLHPDKTDLEEAAAFAREVLACV